MMIKGYRATPRLDMEANDLVSSHTAKNGHLQINTKL